MRKSTEYLMWMPAKFSAQLGLCWIAVWGIFLLLESRLASQGPLHDSFGLFALIVAALASSAGLMAMVGRYLELWLEEISLGRYLAKLGVSPC